MAPETSQTDASTDREILMTRIFDAPRSLVFKAWTSPEILARWWGPRSFTLPNCTVDPRPGGAYSFHMRGPNGDRYRSQGTFLDVVEPERIVFRGSWVDDNGNPIAPQAVVTVTLEEV